MKWYCKHLHKRIERSRSMRVKLKRYIKQDQQELKNKLKKLSTREFFEFGVETGYIEKGTVKK